MGHRPLPRPHRRGLIEAGYMRELTPQYLYGLFRGLTAAASLKLEVHEPQDRTVGTLPRPHRRGLIEAHAIMARHGLLAPLPRPHRRGLIEA